ncbi:iron superoxide dismutase [Leishmania mexicana MHOM/GT/2001/U1103]|uniref:Superoxide dismutase n=1 Tax=Leishmania mexicana (strain MHOM/GT/2001/U1103) TaxID=929439 RepID=E9AMA8_LEIMU|nr:iron superoxide dismutase [Leishmania mexicana MHOM/GT/2001/U1103]CBZ24063.1 iron superoxide dismutase [Leishmania mexicana MHOM/GT/2001/U1103]
MFRRVSMKAPTAPAAVGFSFLGYHTLPHLRYPADLPKLGFNCEDGIKPVMSPRQLELHYTKHHRAYVDKLNTLGDGCEGKMIEEIILETSGIKEKKVMFNQAAQHFNHSFFWKCLTPGGRPMPKTLEDAIAKHFGSVKDFKVTFQQCGMNNFGSGWTWLCVDPQTKQLRIDNTSNADCPLTSGLRPIFTADVWEHAYYKDFENRRADYLKELWQIVDWEFVSQMYEKATK